MACVKLKITDGYKSQVPKVVFDKYQNLMYMSRAPIPNNKNLNNNFL